MNTDHPHPVSSVSRRSRSKSKSKPMSLSVAMTVALVVSLGMMWIVQVAAIEVVIGYGAGNPSSAAPASNWFENPNIEEAYYVIQAFKAQITCDPKGITDSWKGPNVCSDYKGFKCATPPGSCLRSVSDIQFNGYGLAGPLTGLIDKLPNISIVHMNSNNFHGRFPDNLGTLPFLFELDLSNNQIDGPVPASVLKATRLTFLDLRFNRFTGRFPVGLLSLPVDALFINNNRLEDQPIPDCFNIPALYLTFSTNGFTGPIPRSIGLSRLAQINLQEIVLFRNQLSGCIPRELGMLGVLRVLDASRNQLVGCIPASFGCLSKLQLLDLSYNRLSGTVPEGLCRIPGLVHINLTSNYFTGVGPACRKLVDKGLLDLKLNCIRGLQGQRCESDCKSGLAAALQPEESLQDNWCPCNFDYLNDENNKNIIKGRKALEKGTTTTVPASSFLTYQATRHPRHLLPGGDELSSGSG